MCNRGPAANETRTCVVQAGGAIHVGSMLDPHPVLNDLLANVGELCRARAVAVWALTEDGIAICADWRLDRRSRELLAHTWDEVVSEELRVHGRGSVAPDIALFALRTPNRATVGVLQYVGDLPTAGARVVFLDETITRVAEWLAGSMCSAAPPVCRETLLPFEVENDAEEWERRTYRELLDRCGWDVTLAASALEMPRQAFYELLDGLGITRPAASRPRSSTA